MFVLRLTVAVAWALAPPPLKLINGTLVYPLPACWIVTDESFPFVGSIDAVAVACVPLSNDGPSITTVGFPV